MSKSIKNRVFGSDVPLWLKQTIAFRQSFSKSADFGEAVEFVRSNYPGSQGEGGLDKYSNNFPEFGTSY